MTYRVFVTEVPDHRVGARPGASYFYVCVRIAAQLGEGIPKRPKEDIGDVELIPRLDLCPKETFKRRSAANKQMKKICNKLRHQGHEVNPWEPTYSLYVIELKRPKWHKGELPPVYVGQTSIPFEERYAQHLAGGRLASPKVTGKAVGLRMDLVPQGKLYNRNASIAAETRLGKSLQKKGYKVYGPQGLESKKPAKTS